ncbi:hypothetical protein BC826DRAFT_926532, partial [Russula brevipes]
PTFLYPEDGYDPDVIDHTLLQGPFLLACFRHIFTALRTALKNTPGKMPGKRTVAELYDIKLTPETIAYAAIMCRHVLNSKESWAVQDGSFQADVFYHNIVDLFEDKDWADETMAWWNKWVSRSQHCTDRD